MVTSYPTGARRIGALPCRDGSAAHTSIASARTNGVEERGDDPRRWLTLAILLLALVLIVLDNTVLNVAVPTMVRELRTDLPSIQWVIAGYSLVFASLLVIGGRLGD